MYTHSVDFEIASKWHFHDESRDFAVVILYQIATLL